MTTTRPLPRWVSTAHAAVRAHTLLGAACVALATSTAEGQYFGRNKVQYERFQWEVMRTPHFDVHHYPAERLAVGDAARMLERWHTRLSSLLNHPLSERKPIVLYADHPDFQQTNVVSGEIDEGTGGVTESLLDRMVMPLTGSYADNDHILGHEMVHVFQYDIAQSKAQGVGSLAQLPLWVIEGMAEYLSVGPADAHTAMWLRDAVRRNDMPTIRQLSNGARYFPYRYGEALWAYIGGTWGDEVIPRLFRASLASGFEKAVAEVLGMSHDSLTARWHATIRARYVPLLEGRTAPRATGDPLIVGSGAPGAYDIAPAVSPDGRRVAFFSSRSMRAIELYVADAATGELQGKLAAPGITSPFDALSFLYSAGSWSPDGRRIAFVTYDDGDNKIDVADVATRKIVRRIKPRDVGAITTVAWSPDGERIAFSGMDGGISDLYLYDLRAGATRRLTNDRYADLQPAWSPDGRTLVFVTDRGTPSHDASGGSDFARLRHGSLRLALVDVATGAIRDLPRVGDGKQINPQFAPDGRSIYFIGDRDGFSDIYRLETETGALFRVTRTASGVSGIAATSPALSVARESGRLVFTVFEKGGFHIAALPPERARGERVDSMVTVRARAVTLPSEADGTERTVAAYLADAERGLPPVTDTAVTTRAYHTAFRLAAIGQPSLGVGGGGGFGTQVLGGASAYFTDVLGNHALGIGVQAGGRLRDLGGQVLYLNTERRWNWGANLSRTPYVFGYGAQTGTSVTYLLQHVAVDNASLLVQYPFSTTRRIEMSGGYTHYGYSLETITQSVFGGRANRTELPAPPSLGLAQGSVAYVGDDAAFGFTSPIGGSRFRFELTPTTGTLTYQGVLLDYRRYLFLDPVTFAVRGLHYGRYGADAESDRLGGLFVGDGALVRGYSYESFGGGDCVTSGSGSLAGSSCPQFDRLVGSRLAVANAELRIPLLGTEGFGLIASPLPPIEIAPFVDVGVAWTESSSPVWDLASRSGDRTPVMSAGLSTRLNLFGFAVVEVYYAKPFQRPARGGVWGFQLLPGW